MNAALFRRFACRPAAFLVVWGGQTERETPLADFKLHAARFEVCVGLAALAGVRCGVGGQPPLRRENYLPILGILAGALLFFGILPPGNLIGKVRQLVPELIGQRPFVHVDRNSIGLAAAILHGGGVGHGIGEVHRLAVTGRQRLDAVGGDNRGQLRHICAAGHGDGNGIGAVVHRTGHTVDGEAGDALDSRCGRLPLAGDGHIARRHSKAVSGDLHRFTTCHSQRVGQRAFCHLIAAVRRYGDDDFVALIRLGMLGMYCPKIRKAKL